MSLPEKVEHPFKLEEGLIDQLNFLPPTEYITTPHPFIAIGDLDTMTNRVIPSRSNNVDIDLFQKRLLNIQRKYAPRESTFYYVPHKNLVSAVEARVYDQVGNDNSVGIINLDRYIFEFVDLANHIRLELSRGVDNKLTTRPGSTSSKDQQLEMLKFWLQTGDYQKIILVDDVIAFATTLPSIIELIRRHLPNAQVNAISGICSSKENWSGKEKLERLGVQTDAVITAIASPSEEGSVRGMAVPDSRDSTVFGGKVGVSLEGKNLSFPYFYPFSIPNLSLIREDSRFPASMDWIEFNIDLIEYINGLINRQMTIHDLELGGFGIPSTSIEQIKEILPVPQSEDTLLDYLLDIKELTPSLVKLFD